MKTGDVLKPTALGLKMGTNEKLTAHSLALLLRGEQRAEHTTIDVLLLDTMQVKIEWSMDWEVVDNLLGECNEEARL